MVDGLLGGGGPSEGGLRRNEIQRAQGRRSGQPGCDASTLAIEDDGGAGFGGARIGGLLHHEVLHVHLVAVAGGHSLHIGGQQQADAGIVSRGDFRSKGAGSERGGRSGSDLLQNGGIRRESHQVRQDQQDALILRDGADGGWIGDDANVMGACAGRKLGGLGLRERRETRLRQFGDHHRLARITTRRQRRGDNHLSAKIAAHGSSYRRSPDRAYSAPTTGSAWRSV